ncbi:MAG: cysteine desulfurase-like protein [Gammaproteobacteria bacterium]|jgi:cysteine desulfurase family protein (TIGR01976 family)
MLDLAFARQRFPGLDSDWAFMDNAGGSHVLDSVIDSVADYMRRYPVQLGASYPASREASGRQEAGAAAMAELVNATHPEEIVVCPSTTVAIGRLARALRGQLRPGDEIIVTDADHEANITPWRRLEADGIRVLTWQLNPDSLRLELDDLEALMGERTRLVCFTHTSNVLGSIEPVAEITRFVHERGARVCVDGVAFAPHRLVDVRAWDVDFYAFSLYKVYGPHLAVLYGKRDALLALDNLNHDFFSADLLPAKLQPGASPYELTASLPAINDYLAALGRRSGAPAHASPRECMAAAFDAMAAHEQNLTAPLLDLLGNHPAVRIFGESSADADKRAPTLSFTVDGRDSADFPAALDRQKIAIRFGHFYARRLIEKLGLTGCNGVVRISLAHYNTPREVDRLVGQLERLLG